MLEAQHRAEHEERRARLPAKPMRFRGYSDLIPPTGGGAAYPTAGELVSRQSIAAIEDKLKEQALHFKILDAENTALRDRVTDLENWKAGVDAHYKRLLSDVHGPMSSLRKEVERFSLLKEPANR
jgi:hypothetical protein